MSKALLAVTNRLVKPVVFVSSYMFMFLFVLMSSELIFGKGAALSSNIAYREAAKSYYNFVGNYLCNLDEKLDPSGRFHSLGSQMLKRLVIFGVLMIRT